MRTTAFSMWRTRWPVLAPAGWQRLLLLALAWALVWAAAWPSRPLATRSAIGPFQRQGDSVSGSVVIITLDGVRPHEVFHGAEPSLLSDTQCQLEPLQLTGALHRLAQRGGHLLGAQKGSFSVNGPSYVSLPGYLQLFSGRTDLPCLDNGCPRTTRPTIVDRVTAKYGDQSAVVISSWPELERAAVSDPGAALVSCGRSGGSTRARLAEAGFARELLAGSEAASAPGHGDYRPDELTAKLGLEVLRTLRPKLLFVGLGDTDEYAHQGRYDAYLSALRSADDWVGRFADLAAELTRDGHPVTLFVTTDHGRGAGFKEHGGDPESAQTWLLAAGAYVKPKAQARAHRLADVAPTVAALLDVSLNGQTGRAMSELIESGPTPRRLTRLARLP